MKYRPENKPYRPENKTVPFWHGSGLLETRIFTEICSGRVLENSSPGR